VGKTAYSRFSCIPELPLEALAVTKFSWLSQGWQLKLVGSVAITITGTGGLPQRPGDAQMSTFPTVDIETLPTDSTSSTTDPSRPWQKGDPIVEPQGVYRLPNGKLVLSRECS